MPTTTPKFGAFEGCPVRFVKTEAWVFAKGAWHQIDPVEVSVTAHVLDEQAYRKAFGDVPDLPKTAFHSGG